MCVDQRTQDLRKELNHKTDETQVDVKAVKMSFDTRTNSILETVAATRKTYIMCSTIGPRETR